MVVGLTCSLLQQLLTLRVRENSSLNLSELLLQLLLVVSGVRLYYESSRGVENPVIFDVCEAYNNFSPELEWMLKYEVHLMFDHGHFNSYSSMASANILFLVLYSIILLKRTETLKHVLVMLEHMVAELSTFFSAFGAIIFIYLAIFRLTHGDIVEGEAGLYDIFKDIFDTFNGHMRQGRYLEAGEAYMTTFQVLSRVFFLGLLGGLFVLRYVKVNKSIEAYKRKEVIKLKNSISYDSVSGAFTMTFFPINLILLPFLPAVLLFKSERLSDTLLKV
mmetsp:Transcript_12403/g.19380  ORF Transcript_12403/g.19380 Transcript_12403/m.19380 type:complete len:276 (+) Transcript_12403:2325-3152(+)